MDPADVAPTDDGVFTLAKFIEYQGTFGQLLVLPGVALVLWWLVAGLRARFAGRDTTRAVWWLTATVRVLWIGGIVGYVFSVQDSVGEFAARAGGLSGRQLEDVILTSAVAEMPILAGPLAVAFAGAVAILLVGPSKQPPA